MADQEMEKISGIIRALTNTETVKRIVSNRGPCDPFDPYGRGIVNPNFGSDAPVEISVSCSHCLGEVLIYMPKGNDEQPTVVLPDKCRGRILP